MNSRFRPSCASHSSDHTLEQEAVHCVVLAVWDPEENCKTCSARRICITIAPFFLVWSNPRASSCSSSTTRKDAFGLLLLLLRINHNLIQLFSNSPLLSPFPEVFPRSRIHHNTLETDFDKSTRRNCAEVGLIFSSSVGEEEVNCYPLSHFGL